jgi:hypothetical protein
VQASLLLSLEHYVDFEVSDESQFWLNVSLTTFDKWMGLQPEKEIWDASPLRLWWSLYVVNNTMSFRRGETGPTTIQRHDVGLPSLSRLGTLVNMRTSLRDLKSSILLRQPYLQKLLAVMFIHRLRLHRTISKIMGEAAELGIRRAMTSSNTTTERSHCRLKIAKIFSKWDAELDKWWCGLPDYAADLKSASPVDDSSAIRILSFHFTVTATEFFSIYNAISSFLLDAEESSSFWLLSVKHKQSMNSAKLLHIVSMMDERDLNRYLLSHGLHMVELALQQGLSSPQLSPAFTDIGKVLLLTKKVLNIRTDAVRDKNTLARLMKDSEQDLGRSEELPSEGAICYPVRENSAATRTDSPSSVLPSSSEVSAPNETPFCYGNMTEDLDVLFTSCDGYSLVEDPVSPCDNMEWLET